MLRGASTAQRLVPALFLLLLEADLLPVVEVAACQEKGYSFWANWMSVLDGLAQAIEPGLGTWTSTVTPGHQIRTVVVPVGGDFLDEELQDRWSQRCPSSCSVHGLVALPAGLWDAYLQTKRFAKGRVKALSW